MQTCGHEIHFLMIVQVSTLKTIEIVLLENEGCSTFLVKRQMELSRKVEMWNNLVNISVTQIY